MADDNANADERLYSIGVRDYAAAPSSNTAPTTRRTSVSSEDTMSRNQEQQSSYASMQASQGSLQSQGDSSVRRPRARQDYGMGDSAIHHQSTSPKSIPSMTFADQCLVQARCRGAQVEAEVEVLVD